MKRTIVAVFLVLVFATAAMAQSSTRLSVLNSWPLTIKMSHSDPMEHSITGDCVEIDINNKKTILRVCKCGSVEVLEYKELIKNKDATTTYYWGNGNAIQLAPNTIAVPTR